MAEKKDNKKKKVTAKKIENKKSANKKSELEKIKESLMKDYDEPTKKEMVVIKPEKGNTPVSKKPIIIGFIIGLVIGLIIMLIFSPTKVATTKDGEQIIVSFDNEQITADGLYKAMKEHYSVNILLDKIDEIILNKLYPEDNNMRKEVNETADYYISSYETYYGYTEEEFLKANGFDNRDKFTKYLALGYRRNKYLDDYAKSLITDDEINKYYNDKVYGDIKTKYIKVEGNDDAAKDLVKRIYNRLNNGQSFDEIVEHYKDQITSEDLGYVSYDNTLDEAYSKALLDLKENSYTKEAVTVDNNSLIIFRYDSKEKAKLEDIKENIIKILANELKGKDENLSYKALIQMRKNANIKFEDESLAKEYNKYIESYSSNN